MKTKRGIILSPELLGLILQRQNFQVSQIIFQVSGRLGPDIVINSVRGILIGDAEGSQGTINILSGGAVIMDRQI